ncbi:MAG: LysR family transcriptional regulator [Novosphingobium sp.]|nr:LysR family transcriptional regulator [Novosphingobium sp.]
MVAAPTLKIKIQLYCGNEIAMGPGKADLLDAIEREGSISAAARAMGMSYRRAWLLVDAMNRCWTAPLVATAPDGSARSGARVTELGKAVLRNYRALQHQARRATDDDASDELRRALLDAPRAHQ